MFYVPYKSPHLDSNGLSDFIYFDADVKEKMGDLGGGFGAKAVRETPLCKTKRLEVPIDLLALY